MEENIMLVNRMKQCRLERQLSQKAVAEVLGCSQVAYNFYEQGKRKLPIEKLKDLAVLYETSTDFLVGLTNNKKPIHKKKRHRSQPDI